MIRRLSLSPLLLAAGLVGCGSSEPPPAPPQAALTLDFRHVIADAPLVLGQGHTTRYGQVVRFEHIRYWVTNVALGRDGQTFEARGSYFLIEQTPAHERLSVTVRGIPPGTYDTVTFHIGVDPSHNLSHGFEEGELARGIGMDAPEEAGYLFFRTDGRFQQEDLEGPFSFRIGTNVLYKRLTGALDVPLELTSERESRIVLEAEVDRVFAGVNLATEAEIEGGTVDSPAARVAGNYSRMFKILGDHGAIALSPTSPNTEGPIGDDDIPKDATPPVLTEPIVALADALVCAEVPNRPPSEARACLTPFVLVPESTSPLDAGLFTFVTANGEPVVASAPGVVADVRFLEHSHLTHSDLFQVSIRSNQDSAFWMDYRNIKDLVVAEGDTVVAGQRLGGAGDYFDPAFGAISFGVRRTQELTQRLCPTRYSTLALTEVYLDALGQSNAAFPGTHDAPCASASLLCTGQTCDAPADFVAAKGDVDEGRRIYKESCAVCHGDHGEGTIGPVLCAGTTCACKDCGDHATLAASIEHDMPPEGYCDPRCAADVAAFILHQFEGP